MESPQYPSVQGQNMPDLGLAQYASYHLGQKEARSSGSSEMDKGLSVSTPMTALYTNSDSTGPVDCEPSPLVGANDITNMGIDPAVPYYDLELANEFEVKTPAELSAPSGIGSVTEPTFRAPDMSMPGLQAGDLSGQGIDYINEFEPDPQTGDLLVFAKPGGLTMIAAWNTDPLAPDPMAPDLDEYDHPSGLDMPAAMTPDPTLPDLQTPDLEPEVHMQGRPGDLAANALGEVDADPTYNALPADSTNELWMQQDGDNQRRERHMGMMELGLDKEERG